MSDRYDSFEIFMVDVVNYAESIISLKKLFDLTSSSIVEYCIKLISSGWTIFLAVAALLLLGPIVFGITLVSFLLTPIGLIAAAALGVAAAAIIKEMYKNKVLPLAIKKVGEKYKAPWENAKHDHSSVDQLVHEAAYDLLRESAKYSNYFN